MSNQIQSVLELMKMKLIPKKTSVFGTISAVHKVSYCLLAATCLNSCLRSSGCAGRSAMQHSIFKKMFYLALVEFWNFVKLTVVWNTGLVNHLPV